MELERVGEPNDPVEGSNVTLICSISALQSMSSSLISMWSYQIKGNGAMQTIDDKNPPPGLQAIGKLLKAILGPFPESSDFFCRSPYNGNE